MRFTLYFTFFVLYCGQAMAVDLIKMTAIQQKTWMLKLLSYKLKPTCQVKFTLQLSSYQSTKSMW